MYYYRENQMEPYSTKLLTLLNNFSGLVLTVKKLNNELMKNEQVNSNLNFTNYLTRFDSGAYFHFRSQGYLEGLIQTKGYNQKSMCYFLTNLLYPASNRFKEAFNYHNKTKYELAMLNNANINKLTGLINELNREREEIITLTNQYNISC